NLWRDRARGAARRVASEAAVARDEAVPSGAEILAELEVAEALAREVAALEEPLRLVVHLRYFEDRTPDEIAARCALPRETVRTRLRRGLARLRERMDRAHGGERSAWMLALAPLARSAEGNAAGAALAGGTVLVGTAMTTKLLLSGAAAVAAVGLLIWTRTDEPAAPPALAATPAVVPTPLAEPAPIPAPASTPAREPAPPEAPPPGAGAAQATEPRVAGTVIVTDEAGAEHAQESGVLTLATGTGPADAEVQELAFTDGRFEVELPAGHWIVFGKLVAGGREARLPEPSPIVPGDDPLVVRGQWLARGRLRVIDAHTRRELAGLELRHADGWPANPSWTHPGEDPRIRTVLTDAASPLALPERQWLTPYWVHAPGHAWARIDFDHRAGGERTLELVPEHASLAVQASGELPAGAFVRLYARGEEPRPSPVAGVVFRRRPPEERVSWEADASTPAAAVGPTRLADLACGDYLVTIEVGESQASSRLGSAEVSLAPGAETSVTVPIDASVLDVPRTHLTGTLRLPPGFERTWAGLRIERLDGGEEDFHQALLEMSFAREQPDLLRWDAGQRRTGTYVATIHPLQYRERVETGGPGSETHAELVVPPLVTVTVEVVEAGSGAPLAAEVSWRGPELREVNHGFTRMDVRRNAATGALEFVAAEGDVEVSATLPGYREGRRTLQLVGPAQTCRIELQRASGVQLAFQEGEAALPLELDWLWNVRVRTEEGVQHPDGRQVRTGRLTLFLVPGRYTLEFPPLPGYEPLAPVAVEVRADEVTEVVVSAVRVP
ncbi:MAG TPA: sigma factor-like helix-turn-helix DNA-binding protein, partial [Planctomycetota bacterium]